MDYTASWVQQQITTRPSPERDFFTYDDALFTYDDEWPEEEEPQVEEPQEEEPQVAEPQMEEPQVAEPEEEEPEESHLSDSDTSLPDAVDDDTDSDSSDPPERQLRALEVAEPGTVFFATPYHSSNAAATKLWNSLLDAKEYGFLPLGEHIDRAYLRLEGVKASCYTPHKSVIEQYRKVVDLHASAKNALGEGDEAALVAIVRDVLRLASTMEGQDTAHTFNVKYITTQTAHPKYHPKPKSGRLNAIRAKELDLCLQLFNNSPQMQELKAGAIFQWISLTHYEDAINMTNPRQCFTAVKIHGPKQECLSQLATTHACAIGHARDLVAMAGQPDRLKDLIQIGCTVVGHDWNLYLSFGVDGTHNHCIGPLVPGLGTDNPVRLYRLLAVLRALLRWIHDESWPISKSLYESALDRQQRRLSALMPKVG